LAFKCIEELTEGTFPTR